MENAPGRATVDGMTHSPRKIVIPGLYPSPPESLPFGAASDPLVPARARGRQRPRLQHHERDRRHLAPVPRPLARGGFVPAALNAPVFVHARTARTTEKEVAVRASFSRRHMIDDDFEVIPIPGHTPGATAYLWDSGDHRMLFTGDTIVLRDGEWGRSRARQRAIAAPISRAWR